MTNTKALIEQAYSAFNRRDIEGALALMTEDVSWPKASEGRKMVGKVEIRAYWTRQWGDSNPHVEPLAIIESGDGRDRVSVHQLVKGLQGEVLSESEVLHVFAVKKVSSRPCILGMRPIPPPVHLLHLYIDPN